MSPLVIVLVVGLTAVVLALGGVVWQLARDSRVREAARVQLLQGLAFPHGVPSPAAVVDGSWEDEFASEQPSTVAAGSGGPPLEASSRRWLALAAVGVCMSTVVAVYAISHRRSTTLAMPAAATSVAALAVASSPYELLSLTHEYAGSRAFIVAGELRIPAGGAAASGLSAVVDLFDRAGRTLATARAAVSVERALAGAPATFSVTLPPAADMATYRIEFRRDSAAVPHVDRRMTTAALR